MASGRNILIFHSGALGDFVLTWPLILAVARTMPQCRTIVVTGGDKGKLAERVLGVESRDVEGGWHALFGESELPEKPAKLVAGARLVLSFVAEAGSAWESNVKRLAPEAEVRCLAPRPPAEAKQHISAFLLDGLADDAVLHASTAGMLESINKSGLMPRAHDAAGPVVVHPGSGSLAKNWPAEKWLAWIETAQATMPVRVLLGEAERERLPEKMITAFADTGAEVVHSTTLLELLAALTGVRGFVGHDSGPTHLAAMLGLPTLALFGPSDPAVWKPTGPRVSVVHHDPLTALPLERVEEAVNAALE